MQFYSSRKRGFTLIELMVAVAIIGILVTVVYASLGEARKKARDAQRVSDLQQVQLALRLYKDVHGLYPGLERDGDGNIVPISNLYENGVALSSLTELSSFFGGSAPKDPQGGEYFFNPSYDCNGPTKNIILVHKMETKLTAPPDDPDNSDDDDILGNWNTTCNGGAKIGDAFPDENSYVVILK